MSIPTPPLLLVTDRRQARVPLPQVVEAALGAGCRWLSLREKDLPAEEQIALLRALAPLARRHGARLTLHGEAALACGCDGVHLAAGGDVTAARVRLGPQALIGLSVHAVAEAAALDPSVVDYIVAGPAFETESKPGYRPTGLLGDIVRASPVPVIAIGGIDAVRTPAVLAKGCAGIAVMGGIMRAADPAGEVRALLASLAHSQGGSSPSPGRGGSPVPAQAGTGGVG